jgi:hypothetical protein|tara:strand:- start:187 stop:534 length:348 start_codon:yes stop_codon:yes gene_type:complete
MEDEMNLFRELSGPEQESFRHWARENWNIGDKVSSIWHPVVQEECARMLDEEVRINTKKYDSGTLDWNFAYKDMVVALDSSNEELSEEAQYEMAIEHFWESEWGKVSGSDSRFGF